MKTNYILFIVVLSSLLPLSMLAVTYPEPIRNKKDIVRAPADTTMVRLPDKGLPVSDYPLLAKFEKLEHLDFKSKEATSGADDERLRAIAEIGFRKLFDVNISSSENVTDQGLKDLLRLPAIRMLALEGTSISDAGLSKVVDDGRIEAINVANTPNVTYKGIASLTKLKSLKELGFGTKNLTQPEAEKIIRTLPKGAYCMIVMSAAPDWKWDQLREIADDNGIKLVVRRGGRAQ